MYSRLPEALNSRYAPPLLLITIAAAFWLINLQHTGPAYLSDEIGYLSKAIAFAGHEVDLATSWHAGYSILISPIFALFTTPATAWPVLMAVQALAWAASFGLVLAILRQLAPNASQSQLLGALAISALYPAWISMSGYAFATTGFALCFCLAAYALARIRDPAGAAILCHSLPVAYLYWIHPVGLAVAVASTLAVLFMAFTRRRYTGLALHLLALSAVILCYELIVHDWFRNQMTAAGYSHSEHYQSLGELLGFMAHSSFWQNYGVLVLGQIGYVVAATLGLFAIATAELLNALGRREDWPRRAPLWLLIVLAPLGIIGLGALNFAAIREAGASLRIDHWVYGRYLEMALLPAFAAGIMGARNHRRTAAATGLTLLAGLFLWAWTSPDNTSSVNILANIQGFWPQALESTAPFWRWFALGAVGVALALTLRPRYLILLALPLYAQAIGDQADFHQRILTGHSKPTAMVPLIRAHYEPGRCIGYDPRLPEDASLYSEERRKLYTWSFFDYDLRRMTPAQWHADCNGPYLTRHPAELRARDNVSVVARHNRAHLYMAVRDADRDRMSAGGLSQAGATIELSGDDDCLQRGCLNQDAKALARFSQTGEYRNGLLATTGEAGYLFFGPYTRMEAGEYRLVLDLRTTNPQGGRLDVVHQQGGERVIARPLAQLVPSTDGRVRLNFRLDQPADDIEIRLRVSPATAVAVRGYRIKVR